MAQDARRAPGERGPDTPVAPAPAPDGQPSRAGEHERRVAAAALAADEWRAIGLRLRGVRPIRLARYLLDAGVVLFIAWLFWHARDALAPVWVGMILAWLLLPLVGRLARRLPRWAAALAVVLGVLVFVVWLVQVVVSILLTETAELAAAIPSQAALARWTAALPPGPRAFVDAVVDETVALVQANILTVVSRIVAFIAGLFANLLGSIGFLLGFLLVPFWLFTVLNDHEAGLRALDRLLPPVVRRDAWTVLTIIDRDLARWFRAQTLICLIIGSLVFLGLNLLAVIGVQGIRFTLLFAAIAFAMEYIPYVGALIGAIPAVIYAFIQGWETGLAVTALYLVVQQVEGNLLAPRILSDAADIHPALMTPAMLALSQVGGLLLVFLAAPLTVVLRDLVVYVHGRLREPPEPAGWLLAPAPAPAVGDQATERDGAGARRGPR